jgi:hypothetical protein
MKRRLKEVEMVGFRQFVWFGVALAILLTGIALFPFKEIFYVLGISVIPVSVWLTLECLDELEAFLEGR